MRYIKDKAGGGTKMSFLLQPNIVTGHRSKLFQPGMALVFDCHKQKITIHIHSSSLSLPESHEKKTITFFFFVVVVGLEQQTSPG